MFMQSRMRPLFILASASAAALIAPSVAAQQVRIENVWKPSQAVNIETGDPQATVAAPGWLSAQWVVEPIVFGSDIVRIKNVWKGTYLNVETGKLQSTAIQPGWLSAQWRLVPTGEGGAYRIENVWKSVALNVEGAALAASSAPANWLSARWVLRNKDGQPYWLPVEKLAIQAAPATQTAAAAPAATADCNRFDQLGKCLDENIGQPTRDFFNKTVPAPFQAGGVLDREIAKPTEEFFTKTVPGAFSSGGVIAKAFGDDPQKFQVQIDFCHSDISDTNTADNITVEFYADEGYVAKKTVAGNASDCGTFSKGVLNFYLDTGYDIRAVKVSTDGGDAMFIDQLRLYKGNATVMWAGRDNGRGWCLSKDANDGSSGGWETRTRGCGSTLTFDKASHRP